jgi:AraC family transcriptional regulator
MTAAAIEDILAERFRIDRPPTLLARCASKARIGFSRMRSNRPMRGRSLAVPPEEAFSFHVPLSVPFFSDLWMGGGRKTLPLADLGDSFLFDLSDNPVVGLNTPFDSLRFYVPKIALDEMASERGIRRTGGLRACQFGGRDPIMFGLAQALAGAMERPHEVPTMFPECIAQAFFVHIIYAYGGASASGRGIRGRLASWQIRRVREFIEDNLDGDPSIFQLAQECGLSGSHFARSFKETTGTTPHRWLTRRRVERAKELLRETDLGLADIAQACGFVDQSHFARIFSTYESYSPGRWRRLARS